MSGSKSGVNLFAVWVSVAVVVVLVVLGGLVVWLNNRSDDAPAPDSAIVDPDTGAISIGDGPDEVGVWFDFYCPHCQDFEDIYGPELQTLVDDGDITLNLHPVALSGLNAASGTQFSERSGGALYCVADAAPEAALPFFQELFALKPSGAGLSDDQLADLAADAGAADAADCIDEGAYRGFVVDQVNALPTNPATGNAGTPALTVNGEYVATTGDVQADVVERLHG